MKNPRHLPVARYSTSLRNETSVSGEGADLHRFIASPAGVLVHYTNNQLRAIVPPQGFDEFLVAWPEAASTVAELRRSRAEVESLAKGAIAKAMASSRLVRRE